MNVLIIPEDFRKDQYILKPLFKRLFADLGRPRANVRVCQDPLLGGVGEALKSECIQDIVDRYRGMTDLFILCVDRDGNKGRRQRLDQIEREFGNGFTFLAENAWEEVETWLLAGVNLPKDWRWADVRAEVHVKETYFEPLVAERREVDGPGGGRKALATEAVRTLAEEATGKIRVIRQKCPDDFNALARRLEALL